ncbi:hypothetical protein SCHPADRAFT_905221 [Schizopora paradoxa]|uniref:Hydrophobin n=1 Tax=Schizopora paradoxa TaxID=27342 RepID=A0A0H2RS87_9AGAM|nr:hypothetical protein SCHPADRAFT_905221 [Schizopora paradoxa]
MAILSSTKILSLLGSVLFVLVFSAANGAAQCPTGIEQLQCCRQTTTRSANPSLDALLKLLGYPESSVGSDVNCGVTCSPVTEIGAGGDTGCDADLDCCDGPNVGDGIVIIGCTPVTIL